MPLPRALRKALTERSMRCCEVCGQPNPTDPHHRKRQSQGGQDTLANLLDLCRGCHNGVHHEPKRARLAGYLLPRNAEPEHVPVRRWSRVHGERVLTLLRDDGTIDEEVHAWQELTLWAE